MKKIIKKSLILAVVSLSLLTSFKAWRGDEVRVWAIEPTLETGVEMEQVTLKIEGMTCRSCAKPMQKALSSIPGVVKATVDYDAAQAVVTCKKGKVTDEQLVKTVQDESGFFYTYTAEVINRTE